MATCADTNNASYERIVAQQCQQHPRLAVLTTEAVLGAQWLLITYPKAAIAFVDGGGVQLLLRLLALSSSDFENCQSEAISMLWHLSTVRVWQTVLTTYSHSSSSLHPCEVVLSPSRWLSAASMSPSAAGPTKNCERMLPDLCW